MEEVSKRKNKRHAKIFIKDDEAGILTIKIQDDAVVGLVEVVIVHRLWLIQEDLLSIGVDCRHQGLVLGREIVRVEILALHEEDA